MFCYRNIYILDYKMLSKPCYIVYSTYYIIYSIDYFKILLYVMLDTFSYYYDIYYLIQVYI